jgi:Fe-S cluster assembly protein SufD
MESVQFMNEETSVFSGQFDAVRSTLPGHGLPWLDERRAASFSAFASVGMPTNKLETWKFTRLPKIAENDFRSINDDDGKITIDAIPSLFGDAVKSHRAVFVNGFFRAELSDLDALPDGVRLEPLRTALERDPEFIEQFLSEQNGADGASLGALNAALMDSGLVVHVKSGVRVSEPIEIIRLNGGTSAPVARHPRNLIVLEDGAEATLVKNHSGIDVGGYLTNAVTDIHVGDRATLRQYTVQAESREAIHLVRANVSVGQDATYEAFSLAIGGRLSRSETSVRLEGRGGHCNLSGAYLMRGREHCDNTTVIEHLTPDATSQEVFKGVLDDDSRGVFQGKIIVHKDAQRTDGHQLSKALLLSDRAEMDAKPELEIYADDVKCSHGAATGQLDETSLFYLRSRGIPDALARNLLIQSFMGEALEEISDQAVRDAMQSRVLHWLPAQCFLSEEWRQE